MAELPRRADVVPEQAQVPITEGPGEVETNPSEAERGDPAATALAPAQAPTTPAHVGIAAELAVKRPYLEAFERLLEKSPDSHRRIDIRLGGYSPPIAGTGYPQACEPYSYAFDVIAQEFSEHASLDDGLLSQVIPQLAFDAVVDRGWHSGVKYAITPLTGAAPIGPLPETKWTPFGSYWVHADFLEGYIYRFGLNSSITKWYAEKQLRELSFRSARAVKEAELAPTDVERQLYGGVPMTDRVPAQVPEASSETVLAAVEERERLDAFILKLRDGGMQHPDICRRLDAARFESRWGGFSWQQAYRKHPGRVKTWLSKATKRAVTRRSYLQLPGNSVTR